MFKTSAAKRQFQIDDIKLDPETGQVWRAEQEISLPKLSFQLLKVLAENAPNVLEQNELTSEVWPDMVIGDETLKQRVRLLRKAIGDKAQSPKYIGVVRGRGYRLLPEVKILLTSPATPIEYDLASSDRVPNLHSATTQRLWQRISLGLTGFIIILLTALFVLNQQLSQSNNNHSIRNLAILPFVNVTQNHEDDYLASGMTNELIMVMSDIESLKVSPVSAIANYRHSERSISQIASNLKVGTILDGALYRQNNLIHFSFKLIDTNSSTQLWQAEYDFQSDDILAIQRKVIAQVTSHLKAKLDRSAIFDSLSLTQPTQIVKAYDYYLRGRDYYNRYRHQDNLTAITLYQKALELDPRFGLAYAGLADAYSQGVFQFGASDSWRKRALESAQQAVALEENQAETHKALGLAYYLNGSISRAIESHLRAIKLSPRHAQTATNLGYLYCQRGELDKAMQWNKRARELSPNYATVYTHQGQTFQYLRDVTSASNSFNKSLQLQPDYAFAISQYALFLAAQQDFESAEKLLVSALTKSPNEVSLISISGQIALMQGNFSLAETYFLAANSTASEESNAELGLFLAMSRAKSSGQYDQLIQKIANWEQTRLSNSDSPRDFFLLALAQAAAGDKSASAETIISAVKRGWRNIGLLQSYSWMQPTLELDQSQTAITQIQQKLENFSSHQSL